MRYLLALLAFVVSSNAFAIDPFNMPWKNHPTRDTIYKSSDHPNGIFVLEFHANFCGACNENAANVDELAEHYKDEARVQVLDVSLDRDDREIAAWIRRHQPNHPVVKDEGRRVWNQVGEQYIPTVVIIDCNGQEAFRYTDVWSAAVKSQIRAAIDGLLAVDCAASVR